MANKKSKKNQEHVWELEAPQVNHIFGIFGSLEEAHNAACKVAEPDSPIDETKEYMPLHYYDGEGGEKFYLIWDESLCGYYEEPADLRINRVMLGQVKGYDCSIAEV
jgi:hypothetical protein